MKQRIRRNSRAHVLAHSMAVCALLATSNAYAGYWTPAINYYEVETVRFPLGMGAKAIPNLAADGPRLSAEALRVPMTEKDPDRGYVLRFNDPTFGDGDAFTYLYPRNPTMRDQASMSLWIKPTDTRNQVIAARGDLQSGFTLQLETQYISDKVNLAFVFWDDERPHVIRSRNSLERDTWHHIVITQSSNVLDRPAHVAMYLDGVLEDRSDANVPDGGLLGGDGTIATIGSASKSGYLANSAHYARDLRSTDPIGDVRPFARAGMSEYRMFLGRTLLCSDKTASGDPLVRNSHVPPGTLCSVASDVTSLAQDRMEQASFRARIPLLADAKEHNFRGLHLFDDAPAPCRDCNPRFIADDRGVRQTVARFDGHQKITYQHVPGTSAIGNWAAPYGVSMWIKPDAAGGDDPQTLFASGNQEEGHYRRAGFHIYMQNGKIFAGAWDGECAAGRWRWVSATLPPKGLWQHVAVSYDAPSMTIEQPAGLQLFVNGVVADTKETRHIGGITSPAPTVIGATSPTGACNGAEAAKPDGQFFTGEISELKTFHAPITQAQARQLASRYPNAYEPRYKRLSYPRMDSQAGPQIPRVRGLDYVDVAASTSQNLWVDNEVNPSVELRLRVDWSKPVAKWTGYHEFPHSPQQDCEYVLGGFFWSQPSVPAEEPASALFCFSPRKIGQGLPPFSIGLYYPAYGETLYLTVVDQIMPDEMLKKLAVYSENQGVKDLRSDIRLDVGAYNMIVQMKTEYPWRPGSAPTPNYVSPIYQGAPALVRQVFANDLPAEARITFVQPVIDARPDVAYVDQRRLLDEFDMQLSKDR